MAGVSSIEFPVTLWQEGHSTCKDCVTYPNKVSP